MDRLIEGAGRRNMITLSPSGRKLNKIDGSDRSESDASIIISRHINFMHVRFLTRAKKLKTMSRHQLLTWMTLDSLAAYHPLSYILSKMHGCHAKSHKHSAAEECDAIFKELSMLGSNVEGQILSS